MENALIYVILGIVVLGSAAGFYLLNRKTMKLETDLGKKSLALLQSELEYHPGKQRLKDCVESMGEYLKLGGSINTYADFAKKAIARHYSTFINFKDISAYLKEDYDYLQKISLEELMSSNGHDAHKKAAIAQQLYVHGVSNDAVMYKIQQIARDRLRSMIDGIDTATDQEAAKKELRSLLSELNGKHFDVLRMVQSLYEDMGDAARITRQPMALAN